MKKILFFFILIFIIILCSNNKVLDKKYSSNISYPYFSNKNINNEISTYIKNNLSDNIIIDYDYNDNSKILTFYKTTISNNIIKEKTDTFRISKNSITKINSLKKVTDYDFYNNIYINDNSKIIAFTFDDGPNYNTKKVIDTLKKYNVTATFFLMGKNIVGNEKIVKYMYESGMEIGNHTYNHLLLTKYSKEKINEEILKTNNLIFNIIGKNPTLLRPSYGSFNKKIKSVSNMPIIIWDIDTLDWKYKNSQRIANKILSSIKDGDIVLMHDIYKSTLNSLDLVIPELLNRGYKIVSVSELFYLKNQSFENGKVYGYVR